MGSLNRASRVLASPQRKLSRITPDLCSLPLLAPFGLVEGGGNELETSSAAKGGVSEPRPL